MRRKYHQVVIYTCYKSCKIRLGTECGLCYQILIDLIFPFQFQSLFYSDIILGNTVSRTNEMPVADFSSLQSGTTDCLNPIQSYSSKAPNKENGPNLLTTHREDDSGIESIITNNSDSSSSSIIQTKSGLQRNKAFVSTFHSDRWKKNVKWKNTERIFTKIVNDNVVNLPKQNEGNGSKQLNELVLSLMDIFIYLLIMCRWYWRGIQLVEMDYSAIVTTIYHYRPLWIYSSFIMIYRGLQVTLIYSIEMHYLK